MVSRITGNDLNDQLAGAKAIDGFGLGMGSMLLTLAGDSSPKTPSFESTSPRISDLIRPTTSAMGLG